MTTLSPAIPAADKPKPREWRPGHLVLLVIAAAVLFYVVFWAALGRSPLSGTKIVAVLGYIFIVFTNVSLGALASGAVIEYLHPDWSRFRDLDHILMAVALVVLVAVDSGVAWWLFSSDAGGQTRWIVLGVSLAAIAGGALWSWPGLLHRAEATGGRAHWALWPQHDEDAPEDEPWRMFVPLTIMLGAALGVAISAGYLGISAYEENVGAQDGHALPAMVAGIHGTYVALGDSYSAGEGLPPFAPGTAATLCDRSMTSAYPAVLDRLLRTADPQASLTFTACSGALIREVLKPIHRYGIPVPPQVSPGVQPSVGLVTLTIGGNNAIFSKVVMTCLVAGNCLKANFPPAGVSEATVRPIPPGLMETQWGPATIEEIGTEDATLFRTLRHDYPNARIVVLGYPYLFPTRPAPGIPYYPPACASILNRLSAPERTGIRTLQDEFNARTYEEAAVSGIEFVSSVAIWDGHEPCGASGQFTNSVKPYLNFPNPVNGGSFHPNVAGQQTLAALVACYLDAHQQRPDPFLPGAPHLKTLPADLVTPAQLQLRPEPGLDSVPGAGTVRGC